MHAGAAYYSGNVDILELLLSFGAIVDTRDWIRSTPLLRLSRTDLAALFHERTDSQALDAHVIGAAGIAGRVDKPRVQLRNTCLS